MKLIFNSDGDMVNQIDTLVDIPGAFDAPENYTPDLGAYLAGGVVVPYTVEQAAARRDRPRGPFRWSNVTMQWEDPRPLALRKMSKWNDIKSAQAAADAAGFSHGGNVYQSDTTSAARIQSEVLEAMQGGGGWSTTWTLADNTEVVLTRAQALGVGRALRDHLRTNHAQARVLRATIDAADTIEELEAIAWPA